MRTGVGVKVHAYASRAHYLAHLAPVYAALPDDIRGELIGPRRRYMRADAFAGDFVLVASWVDSQRWARRHRVIYLEHGAGQSYAGDPKAVNHGSYAGGAGHDHTALFLCPSETVADRWRAIYRAPAVAVGCPRLDDIARAPEPDVAAVTFHWDNPLCNESRSALPHYARRLGAVVEDLRAHGVRVLGHGHPRAAGHLKPMWSNLGVPWVDDLDAVLRQAAVLVADNTSAMYESAALDMPVVALNAPWYRSDVEHGLRFWSHVPGRQCDYPDDLADTVLEQMQGGSADDVDLRRRAAAHAYAAVDGKASVRAAEAIMEVVAGGR